jgi:hypothetical protein
MIAGMSNAEYDRRRQISVRQQNDASRRTSLSEIMDMGQAVCPSFAKRPDFRKFAMKNVKNTAPVFKVSVNEIYESSNITPLSFSQQNSNSYGRKRNQMNAPPASRPRYVPIHASSSAALLLEEEAE